jgi:hypothetical protein
MSSPKHFTIEDAAYALEGGSIFLSFRDNDGVQHALILAQHNIPMHESDTRIPGRLYLDNQIIQVRSDEEIRLISGIKSASISPIQNETKESKAERGPVHVYGQDIADFLAATRKSPEAAIWHLVDSLVQFVESDEYLQLAGKFDNST